MPAPKVISKPSKEKPHAHPADSDLAIPGLSRPGMVLHGMPIPHHDGRTRALENHRGEEYRTIEPQDKANMLLDQIGRLETEHFGLKRGYSTVDHAYEILDPDTPAEAYRRMISERLPHVEAELDRLYEEHDAALAAEEAKNA